MLMLGDVIEMAKENVVGPEKVSPALARPSRLPLRQMMEEEEKVVTVNSNEKKLTSEERLNNKRAETEDNIRKEQENDLKNILLGVGDIEGLPETNEDEANNDESVYNEMQNKKKSKKSTSKKRTKSKRKTKKSY